MKIIISGGSGSIGRKLTDTYVEEGHEIVILSRSPEKVTGLPAGARAVQWDGKTAGSWAAELDGADAVVHLAGMSLAGTSFLPSRWTPERRKAILDSRLDTGQALVEAIRQVENKPSVLVQSSAVGYYGVRGDEVVTEEDPQKGDDFLTETAPCGGCSCRSGCLPAGLSGTGGSTTPGSILRTPQPEFCS